MADGSRHSIYAVKEINYGVTPTNPALELVRSTGTTLSLKKSSLQSGEIRSDRQISDFRLGSNTAEGAVNFELSYGSFDDLLQGALLSSNWASTASTGIITLDISGGNTVVRATGSFITDGFEVNTYVKLAGFVNADNNKVFKITSLTATIMTLEGTLVNETGATASVTGPDQIKSGQNRQSFTFIRHFADIPDKPYYRYYGCEIDQLQISIPANNMITGSFTVRGKGQEQLVDLSSLGVPTYPAPSNTTPLDSFTGVLEENGTVIAVITDISISLKNNINSRFVVGQKDSIQPSLGRSDLTGQITAYFEDSTLVDKFVNENESSIRFHLPDADGNVQTFIIPRLKYTGGQPDVSGEGPITLTMPFQALLDTATGTNFIINRTAI